MIIVKELPVKKIKERGVISWGGYFNAILDTDFTF